MGFIENLAKGFVRSAVNQVGRDTGKVVSNRIYGDAHATPIRSIKQSNGIFYDEGNNELSELQIIEKIKEEGYNIKYFNLNPFLKTIYWWIGLAFTSFINYEWGKYYALIPPLIIIAISYLKYSSSKSLMTIWQTKEIATYKEDRRYKNGKRFVGFTKGKVEYNMPPTKTFIKKTIVTIITYIILAIYMYSLSIYFSIAGNVTWSGIGINVGIVFLTLLILHLSIKLLKPKNLA